MARVPEGAGKVRTGLHICRGNWSQDESTLLSGIYDPLKPYLERLSVRQLVLEYATERAVDLPRSRGIFSNRPVNSAIIATDKMRAVVAVAQAARRAL